MQREKEKKRKADEKRKRRLQRKQNLAESSAIVDADHSESEEVDAGETDESPLNAATDVSGPENS